MNHVAVKSLSTISKMFAEASAAMIPTTLKMPIKNAPLFTLTRKQQEFTYIYN